MLLDGLAAASGAFSRRLVVGCAILGSALSATSSLAGVTLSYVDKFDPVVPAGALRDFAPLYFVGEGKAGPQISFSYDPTLGTTADLSVVSADGTYEGTGTLSFVGTPGGVQTIDLPRANASGQPTFVGELGTFDRSLIAIDIRFGNSASAVHVAASFGTLPSTGDPRVVLQTNFDPTTLDAKDCAPVAPGTAVLAAFDTACPVDRLALKNGVLEVSVVRINLAGKQVSSTIRLFGP